MEGQFKIGRGHIWVWSLKFFLCSFEVDRKGKDMPKLCDWDSDQWNISTIGTGQIAPCVFCKKSVGYSHPPPR